MTDNPKEQTRRFAVLRLGQGPWLVLDHVHADRLVASCPREDEAYAIAAIMNRDPVEALKHVIFSLERLDALMSDPGKQ